MMLSPEELRKKFRMSLAQAARGIREAGEQAALRTQARMAYQQADVDKRRPAEGRDAEEEEAAKRVPWVAKTRTRGATSSGAIVAEKTTTKARAMVKAEHKLKAAPEPAPAVWEDYTGGRKWPSSGWESSSWRGRW